MNGKRTLDGGVYILDAAQGGEDCILSFVDNMSDL